MALAARHAFARGREHGLKARFGLFASKRRRSSPDPEAPTARAGERAKRKPSEAYTAGTVGHVASERRTGHFFYRFFYRNY